MSNKPFLHQHYLEQVVPALQKTGQFKNIHEVPQITKVVLNTGFNVNLDKGGITETVKTLSSIAGQKALLTHARLSISNFKLREGMPIGAKVTLRGAAMYQFLYRLIAVALPGIRDFRGVKDTLDGNGNYTLGISDVTIFPEAASDGSARQFGLDICIATSAGNDADGRELLRLMGMPFRKKSTGSSAEAA